MTQATSQYADALERLTAAQKTAYGAPVYSRFVNRPAGRRLAALAYSLKLTPNQVTGISALFSLAAILLLALGPISTLVGIGVAVLLAIGYAFDAADGQLARLTGKGGPGGEWLDHTVDMGKTVLIQGGILVALARAGEANNPWLLALIMAFTTVNVLAFFGWLLADLLQRAKGVKVAHARDSGQAPLLRSLLRAPSDYGVFLWTFVLWGTALFWGVYVLLFVACLAILVAALPVWYRQAAAAGGTS